VHDEISGEGYGSVIPFGMYIHVSAWEFLDLLRVKRERCRVRVMPACRGWSLGGASGLLVGSVVGDSKTSTPASRHLCQQSTLILSMNIQYRCIIVMLIGGSKVLERSERVIINMKEKSLCQSYLRVKRQ